MLFQSGASLQLVLIIDALQKANLQDDDDSEDFEILFKRKVAAHVWRSLDATNFSANLLELLLVLWLEL